MSDDPEKRSGENASGSPPVIRVLVIGGTALFRAGLRALIDQADGLAFSGGGETLADWRKEADEKPPDLVLVDIINQLGEVPEVLGEIQSRTGTARTLIVTNDGNPDAIRRMVVAGASGVIHADAPSDQLLTAIRKIHAGELWVDRTTMARIISGFVGRRRRQIDDPDRANIESLTRREREVVALIADGLGNKAIAARLNISGSTVRHHLTSVYEKLGAPDRTALVVYAIRHNLASP